MRRAIAVLLVLTVGALAALSGGCGGAYKLPTETRKDRVIPSDKSYQMIATWTGMDGIRDILLTQGAGTQLFLLFNHGGAGTAPRGEVFSYARSKPTGPQAPIPGIGFPTLFNPVALCSGGDGASAANNRIYVLDQGDTCLARANPTSGACGDTTGRWNFRISDLGLYWRVREYGLLGGDTLSTFTDTTMAFVNGVAADAQGRVYVSGLAIVYLEDPVDPRLRTRTQQWRIRRYLRGLRYPGIVPADRLMPGANWHRDTTWTVEEGSGIGTVVDPRGIFWGPYGGSTFFASDFGKNWIQKLSDQAPSTGFYQLDGSQTGTTFNGALDVTVDLQGYLYIADTGNRRVLRYDPDGLYVQRVDVENDASGNALANPVTVAADDSLAFVGDAGASEVIRYKRRP